MTPEFLRAWDYLEPAALIGRGHNRQTVWDAISEKRARLWLLDNSAIVTNIWKHPSGWRTANAWLAGGDAVEICQWAATTGLEYGRANKCNDARIVGRRGFRKLMPESSQYRELSTIIVRDL
jgi:hypothetical protein